MIRSRTATARRTAAGLILAVAASVGVSACSGGAIGQSTPASDGQDFVSGNGATTVYPAGSGPVAPKVSGPKVGGGSISLASYRGHVVVLNFWGSWCTPCRGEAPVLGTMARRYAGDGVKFVGVDIRDSAATAEAFMRTFGVAYPSLNDPADEIALAFHGQITPAAIPSTLVIGRDGRIAARAIGEVTYSELNRLISQAVAQRDQVG